MNIITGVTEKLRLTAIIKSSIYEDQMQDLPGIYFHRSLLNMKIYWPFFVCSIEITIFDFVFFIVESLAFLCLLRR